MSNPKTEMLSAATEPGAKTASGASAESVGAAATAAGIVTDAAGETTARESAESEFEYAENTGCCCGGRKKIRSEKEHRDLINRLNRIEGQIRGIKGMVEKDAYCIDILNQASAASSALSSFCKILLSSHIRSCVAEDVRQGNEEKMEELVRTLQKMMR